LSEQNTILSCAVLCTTAVRIDMHTSHIYTFAFCVFLSFCSYVVYIVLLDLASSVVVSQEIGLEERLRNDLPICVEWDVKPLNPVNFIPPSFS